MAKILVADDHDDARSVFVSVLRDAGHEVIAAADGIEAVTLFEGLSKPIDHRVLASEVDRLLRKRPRG